MHFLEALEDRWRLSNALLYLRDISGNQGESTRWRKSNYLGEHPVRLQDLLANSILQVGTSITKPCYLKRGWGDRQSHSQAYTTKQGKAAACREENLPAHPGTHSFQCFSPNCFCVLFRSTLPVSKKLKVLHPP